MNKRINIDWANLAEIKYVAKHMRSIDYIEIKACIPKEWDVEDLAWYTHNESELKFIATLDKLPVLAFGLNFSHNSNLAIGWAFGTDKCIKVFPEVTKFIKEFMIPSAVKDHGCRRAEVRVLSTHYQSIKWLNMLGYKVEAEMKNYGREGETFLLMSFTDYEQFLLEDAA